MRGHIPGLPSPHPLGEQLPGVYRDDDMTQRLTAAFARTAKTAAEHRQGPLDQAQAAENAAAARFRHAREERLAMEKLKARQEAEQHKQTERRAEDAVGDWVHASHERRKPRG